MSDQNRDEIVTVYKVMDPATAELIKIMLEDNGIRCELDDETQGGFVGVLDIGIMVHAKDAQRAAQLIQEHYEKPESDGEEE